MTTTRFVGGDVVVDGALTRLDVLVADGRVVALAAPTSAVVDGEVVDGEVVDGAVVDCAGAVVAPGFIDLQCNGAGGIDITSTPERIADVSRVLTRFGVTAYLPTVVTAPAATRARAIAAMASSRAAGWEPGGGAAALGLHFEGPAISPSHVGAHPRDLVTVPDAAEIDEWVASGVVALVTAAPEVPGVLDMIGRLRRGGVRTSAGHTAMSPEEFGAARAAGVGHVTHLFNAMRSFSHRAPGPIGAVLADDDVTVGLICDGIHVDPTAVKMAWRALGPSRMSLVSDAAPPLGGAYGTYALGSLEVVYDESGVRTRDGVLAGSALALDEAVRNLIAFTGCSLLEAIESVTSTPARVLGLTDRGRIAVGNRADLTIIEPDGRLRATVVAGSVEWSARWSAAGDGTETTCS